MLKLLWLHNHGTILFVNLPPPTPLVQNTDNVCYIVFYWLHQYKRAFSLNDVQAMIVVWFASSCCSDVLVFLTGQEEIESMQRVLEKCRTVMPSSCLDLQVCTLFAALPTEQQRAAFTWTKKVTVHCTILHARNE